MAACSGDDEVASGTLNAVKQLVRKGEVRVSAHGYTSPAVVVTAYRPNTQDWDESFIRRRT